MVEPTERGTSSAAGESGAGGSSSAPERDIVATSAGPSASPQPLTPGGAGMAAALGRLALVVLGGILAAVVFHGVSVLVVILAFVLIVMLHELGHFVVAKASGMKVTEYFLGFGPRLWSIRRGETEYGVKAIPAGGYVKIVGMTMLEDVDPNDEARSYRQATFPRRFGVAVAGSAVHMVLAVILFWSVLALTGVPTTTATDVSQVVTFATGPSPAQRAGFRPGDEFVSIDGRAVSGPNQLAAVINSHAGKELTVVVRRHGRLVALHVRPVNAHGVTEVSGHAKVKLHAKRSTGIIGVTLGTQVGNRRVGPLAAVPRAFGDFGSAISTTLVGLGDVFSLHGLQAFAHSVVTAGNSTAAHRGAGHAATSGSGASNGPALTSVVGVIQIGSQAAGKGQLSELLDILALVNISVGLLNLFPMLPLDGGHVAIAVYERIRSRRGRSYHADITKLMPVAYVFLAFVVLLGLGAIYANIVQPVHLPGG